MVCTKQRALLTVPGVINTDQNWITAKEIVERRRKLNNLGINYLLNVGPDGLGRIPSFSVEALNKASELYKKL